MIVCGANLRKKPGRTCRKPPIKGHKRCRLHGGTMPNGAQHPAFKHGRFSKVLPKGLLAKYHAAANDPELLSHQDELRLVDAHLGDLLESLTRHNQRNVTEEAIEAWGLFTKANTTTEKVRGYEVLQKLLGSREAEFPPAWSEIREVVDLRKKVLEAETKRTKELDGYIRREDQVIIQAFTIEAIQRGVLAFVDRDLGDKIIYQIGQDLAVLVGSGVSPSLDAASGRCIDITP